MRLGHEPARAATRSEAVVAGDRGTTKHARVVAALPGGLALLISILAHAFAWGGLLATVGRRFRALPRSEQALLAPPIQTSTRERPAPPELAVAPSSEQLRRDVLTGSRLLGEALILRAELGASSAADARLAYRDLLERLRAELPLPSAEVPRKLLDVLREQHWDGYKALYHDLGNLLLHHGGDCRARTELIVALLYDLGLGKQVGARAFTNHVAPIFHDGRREHRFGLVADCTGLGTRMRALELLRDELPPSRDRCRAVRPLVGVGLGNDDPSPSWTGQEEPADDLCPLADWPWRETGETVFVAPTNYRSGTLDSWFPIIRLEPSFADLAGHARGLDCYVRQLTSLASTKVDADRLLAALGRAVAYGEETALELGAAGELDSARWVEQETRHWYEQAQLLLAASDFSGLPLRAELGSLVHLGPRGQAVLLSLVPHHLCWFGSDLLAILVREPATRERALALYLGRTLPQQIETADRTYWTDEPFQRALERHVAGRRVLRLRAAVAWARARWQSCSFGDLLYTATETTTQFALDPEWAAALVAVLAEDSRLHLSDHHCRVPDFWAEVKSWEKEQSQEIHSWLARQTKER